jgi:hypothetical protein
MNCADSVLSGMDWFVGGTLDISLDQQGQDVIPGLTARKAFEGYAAGDVIAPPAGGPESLDWRGQRLSMGSVSTRRRQQLSDSRR